METKSQAEVMVDQITMEDTQITCQYIHDLKNKDGTIWFWR